MMAQFEGSTIFSVNQVHNALGYSHKEYYYFSFYCFDYIHIRYEQIFI